MAKANAWHGVFYLLGQALDIDRARDIVRAEDEGENNNQDLADTLEINLYEKIHEAYHLVEEQLEKIDPPASANALSSDTPGAVNKTFISPKQRDEARDASYLVRTLVPLLDEPYTNEYVFTPEQFYNFTNDLQECAEFIISVERVREEADEAEAGSSAPSPASQMVN